MLFFKTIILSLSLAATTYAGDIVGGINYGDSRDTVLSKLGSCKSLKSSAPASMFARIGINGAFTTTKDLSGLKFALYFGWTDSGNLKDVNYRSDALVAYNYDERLKEIWNDANNLLSAIYGRARNAGEYPKKTEIKPDGIHYSHEWKTNSGYIYLGIGQEAQKYSINITFSKVSLET